MPFSRSPKSGRTEKGHFRQEHSKLHYFCRTWIISLSEVLFLQFWALFVSQKVIDRKYASFCWNVEYVESCWMRYSKNMLLSAEMLNVLKMLNYFGSMESPKGPNRDKIVQHIQHYRRKKHTFEKRVLSGEIIQHGPKSGSMRGNSSTCASKCASFCWNVEYVESCWIKSLRNVLLCAEMLNVLNVSNYFGSMESQKGPNRGRISQHFQQNPPQKT